MGERERLITREWDMVRDADGNLLAAQERQGPVRAIDLAQMISGIQTAQMYDTLDIRRSLATTHNTLADMLAKVDVRVAANIKSDMRTETVAKALLAEVRASNALQAETARTNVEVSRQLREVTEQLVAIAATNKERQDEARVRAMNGGFRGFWKWVTTEQNQLLLGIGTVVAVGAFLLVYFVAR